MIGQFKQSGQFIIDKARALPQAVAKRRRHPLFIGLSTITAMGAAASVYSYSIEPEPSLVREIITGPTVLSYTPPIGSHELTGSHVVRGHLQTHTTAIHSWLKIRTHRGDSIERLLHAHKLAEPALLALIASNEQAKVLAKPEAGQIILIGLDHERRINALRYRPQHNQMLTLFRQGATFDAKLEPIHIETREHYAQGIINGSLFQAGLDAGLTDARIMEIAHIFGWDIDFALDLRQGDRFTVVYEADYWQGEKIDDGPILAAEFIRGDRTYRALGHRDAEGNMRYYTPEGKSMARQFLRSPVSFSRISSRFRHARYHPVLKRWRAHKGVDYAAARGTPVRATANGTIAFRGNKGGYGKVLIVKHGGKYSTVYAHLLKFAGGLRSGSKVRQGQTIAYVGKSGLATGYHLHYEFRVFGKHVNPLRVKLPGAAPINESQSKDFAHNAVRLQARLDRLGRHTIRLASNTQDQ